jgi:hypothetical protein
MKKYIFVNIFVLLFHLIILAQNQYPWINHTLEDNYFRIKNITLPENFTRIQYKINTFQDWLLNIPLKQDDNEVNLFDGSPKLNQNAHYKIIDIDIGDKDLQQCADAIIRLYAEYLYSQKKYQLIAFNFTSGDRAVFNSWVNGIRPVIKDNKVKWIKSAKYDISYQNLRAYLDLIFTYGGSYSLSKELIQIHNIQGINIGDVFIEGGFPGHGVIVVDKAVNPNNDKIIIMLAQSYMPAQEMHILRNPINESLTPWYELKSSAKLYTPEWTFEWTDLMRFTDEQRY